MDERLEKQLVREIAEINRTLHAFKLNAGTKAAWTIVGGDQLVLYGLKAAPGQAIAHIEARLPELSEAISGCRKSKTLVRLLKYPLRLEVTHPFSKPLAWDGDALGGEPHTMLLGRSYDGGRRDLRHSFDAAPHLLVAGTTGAGKSIAMLNMLLPLCWNTSPADLRVLLIDMKNTDLVPLRRLPHADVLATTISKASQVLGDAVIEMARRQAKRVATPRILIVIDEYADLTSDDDCMSAVGELARKGRSAGISLLVATQHPTGRALGDSTIKNNFAARCVGLVADASAASCAAGRPGTHAELLPGKGAFLYVTGLDCIRYQSYLLDDVTSESLITRIARKWRTVAPSTVPSTVLLTRVVEASRSPQDAPSRTLVEAPEPLFEGAWSEQIGDVTLLSAAKIQVPYDEIEVAAGLIRDMWQRSAPTLSVAEWLKTTSKNAVCKTLFGKPYAGTSFCNRIDAAIARVASTVGSTEPSTTASTDTAHPSEKASVGESRSSSSRSDDSKIMRLPRTGTGGD